MTAHTDLVVVGGGISPAARSPSSPRLGPVTPVLPRRDGRLSISGRARRVIVPGVAEVQRPVTICCRRQAAITSCPTTTYEESRPPEAAGRRVHAARRVHLRAWSVRSCLGHPLHCQTLFDEAGDGATALRGVAVERLTFGPSPRSPTPLAGRVAHRPCAADRRRDGRTSMVRATRRASFCIRTAPHHLFAGMLIEGARLGRGAAGDRHRRRLRFPAFPQGNGRVRLYGSYPLDWRGRFSGNRPASATSSRRLRDGCALPTAIR